MFKRPQFDRRAAGLLFHLTSLSGPHGSGDMGPEAHAFVDFLAAAGQRWWQMLPIVPPGRAPGFSPYSSPSAFAGSPWLISLEQLSRQGLLPRDAIKSQPSNSLADFRRVIPFRDALLRKAHETFNQKGGNRSQLHDYSEREQSWLEDWALFAALKRVGGEKPWFEWEAGIRLRKVSSLQSAQREFAAEIDFHRFVQFQFDIQWRSLKEHCRQKNVGLLGDLPMFVAADSADVWAHRELFTLQPDGRPSSVSGCPPDLFSKTGQLWGHPQYRWANHKKNDFAWWVARFAVELARFDGVRIDHFLGFYRTWAIPGEAKDGRKGKWLLTPGPELFDAVKRALGPAPIIAEDLGLLIPPAAKLRDMLGLPGMRTLQFGFGEDSYHLPHRYIERCVAYTGTHDNETVRGWFVNAPKAERQKALAYLDSSPASIHKDMIRAVMASVAETVIIPVQDVLGLGNSARMNFPGIDEQNWRWRLMPGQLSPAIARELREEAELFGRV